MWVLPERVRRARHLDDDHLHQVGVVAVAVDDERGDRPELLAHRDRLGRRPRGSARASRSSARGTACRAPRPWRRSSGRRGRRRRRPRRRCPTRGRRGSPGGRTRARPRRGSAGACPPGALARPERSLPALTRAPPRASGRPPGGGWRAPAAARGSRCWRSRSSSATMWPSPSGACASTTPHGSTIIERPPECWPPGCAPTWLAAITNAWFSIARARSSVSQWSRVVASVKAAGTRDHARAAHGEDPVELGEAQVVADRQPQLDAVGGLREDDLIARLLELGLAVGAPADLHVEHVQLAIDRPELALRIDVHRGVGELLLPRDALEDRAGDEIDAQLARDRARPLRSPARRAARPRRAAPRRSRSPSTSRGVRSASRRPRRRRA